MTAQQGKTNGWMTISQRCHLAVIVLGPLVILARNIIGAGRAVYRVKTLRFSRGYHAKLLIGMGWLLIASVPCNAKRWRISSPLRRCTRLHFRTSSDSVRRP